MPLLWLMTGIPRGVYTSGDIALVLVILVYSSGRLAYLIARGEPRIVASVFYLSVYVCYGVAPVAEIATGQNPTLLDPRNLAPAAVMVLAGCLARDLGAALGRKRPGERVLRRAREISVSPRVKALSIFGLLGSAYYIYSVGGIRVFFESRQDLSEANGAGPLVSGLASASSLAKIAIVNAVGTVPILIAWIAWTVIVLRSDRRQRLGPWIGWLVLAAVNVVVNNPISNSRYWFLTVVCAFAFSLPKPGRGFFRVALITGTAAAIVVFPFADRYRMSAETQAKYPVASKSVEDSLATKDYDQLTMIANGISWVDIRGGHTLGAQLASSALFFIPHAVWPGRASDTGTAIAQVLPTAELNQNLSAPLWIELWVDFGWLAMILGFFGIGWLSRAADDVYVHLRSARQWTSPRVLEIAIPALVGYEFILLRGSLLQAMARLAALSVCFLLLRANRPADTETETMMSRARLARTS